MRAQLALGCCVSFVLGMLELPRGARARDPSEQAPPLPSLLEDHPGTVPAALARPTGSPWRRVIIPKPAPQLGAHLALQDKLLTPKLAPQHRLFAPRLSPGHGAHLAPWQRLLSPEMAPQLVAYLAPQHKQLTSKFAPWHRLPTPKLASWLGARLAPQDNPLPLRLAPHLGAHLAPQHKPLIPKLAPHPGARLGARLGARHSAPLAVPRGARSRRHTGGHLVRVGCVLGTCQVQNLSHRLWQLMGHPGHRDLAPINPNSPHSYG